MNYNKKYDELKEIFESYAIKYFDDYKGGDDKLTQAMKYSLFVGGKRIRPVILLSFVEKLNGDINEALPFALSLELVHTYSLIHDDMPEMDNDSMRRGKPTNHEVFGQATALLSGDAMLNLAFEICLKNSNDERSIKASKILANCSGNYGMLKGQSLDKIAENKKDLTLTDVYEIYENKTCKLLIAPLLMANALFGNYDEKTLYEIGYNLGKVFQMTDDLLDVVGNSQTVGKTLGKDKTQNKLTILKFFSEKEVRNELEKLVIEIKDLLKSIDGYDFLEIMAESLITRVS